jgi:uncharacterized GH25 family protein
MTLDKRRILIAAAVLVAAALAVFLWLRGRGDDDGDGAGDKAAKAVAGPKRAGSDDPGGASGQLPLTSPVAMDNDPAGDLRLEGQVLGPDDEPVGGALVLLGSVPPRTATSEKDGSFEFDKLIGRAYALTARAGDMVGGPVMHTLREKSDPVVIRLAPGASVEVTVVSAGSGAPIPGASVDAGEGPDKGGPSATTDSKGIALLKGIRPGSYAVVYARASGHAPGHALVQVPSAPGSKGAARIELKAGAPVSGLVVDESGNGIAGAQVAARDVSLPWDMEDERDLATTDDKGRFTVKAVAAGTYRFAATHKEHAPGSSEPVVLDGATEKKDVRIALKAGGIAAGKVVDAGGAPVPWATVRIGSQRGALQVQDAPTRQVIAGQDGTFEVKGLARGPLMAMALSETASSQGVKFDLATAREKRDLVLTLDVTGSIAGVVVDGSGEPVAEAQVTAYPDFFAGERGEDFSLRGPTADTTDGGGAFTLRGLPVGNYRLFASRSGVGQNPFAREGTKARTGATGLKLVLQADGGVKGVVVFEEGGSPGLFTVSAGYVAGVPVASKDGAFELPAIAPGTHDIAIRGPDFAETFVRGVEVASGQVKDVGQVKVKRGRNVSGRVVSAGGKPVAGATVVLGKQLFGDGKSLASAEVSGFEEQMGIRRSTTDGDGRYAMRGIGEKELLIAAEHQAEGRSPASQVAPGKDSVTVDLKLAGVGSVSGHVTAGGKPASSAQIIATPPTASRQNVMVQTGEDGLYTIERLTAGPYKVTAMIGGSGIGGTMASRTVTIKTGQRATLDIDVPIGNITLAVGIQALSGVINSAQIFLFDGEVSAPNAKVLTDKFGEAAGGAKMTFWWGSDPAKFEKIVAGKKSVCVIPITGNLSDGTFQQRLQENLEALKVYCKPVTVTETPLEQSYTAAVPPMDPLPPPQ